MHAIATFCDNMTLNMTRRIIRNHADDDTPKRVAISDSWAGVMMWALGRHGPIVLFVFATWFLYNDNKAYQKDLLEVAKSQISINSTQLAQGATMLVQLNELKTAITSLADEAKRGHVGTK